jgi:hypothetical protein
MQVLITAIRNEKEITFQIEGKDAQEVFRQWQAGPLAKGCTRAALGTKPIIEQRAMPLSGGLPSSWGAEYVMTTCPECSVATHTVRDGNYVNGPFAVHRNGCTKIKPGDLTIAPPL